MLVITEKAGISSTLHFKLNDLLIYSRQSDELSSKKYILAVDQNFETWPNSREILFDKGFCL